MGNTMPVSLSAKKQRSAGGLFRLSCHELETSSVLGKFDEIRGYFAASSSHRENRVVINGFVLRRFRVLLRKSDPGQRNPCNLAEDECVHLRERFYSHFRKRK